MNNAKIRLTREGYERFTAELAAYRAKREPALVKLQAAREQGDLSENGAYKAARFELSDIDREIRRLTYLLKYAEVTEPAKGGTIGFGSTVTLEKDGKEITYQLVSKYDSDPSEGKISVESPLGRQLVGKSNGEEFTVAAPVGGIVYRVVEVQ